jgi:hypothetical protein
MPIVGLRTPAQAEKAASALAWSLSPEQRQELDQLAVAASAAGTRMPANPFQSD